MVDKMNGMPAKELKAQYGDVMSAMMKSAKGPDMEEQLNKLKSEKEEIEEKIKSINVKEDVEALVDGEDLSEEFKEKAATVFEAAVKSRIRSEIERMEESYVVSLDEATSTIKEELSEKE